MKFSIRDLFLVTMIVAVCVAWWLDRTNSRRELLGVQLRLALEEENNKHLTFRAKNLSDLNAIYVETAKKEQSSRKEMERIYEHRIQTLRTSLERARLEQSPMPTSSAPAPIPPKP